MILFGSQFATLDDAEACGFSATGPSAVATLAARLLQAGYDPDRPLVLFRRGQRIRKATRDTNTREKRDSHSVRGEWTCSTNSHTSE